jgi:phosphoglycerate dehydrogenase-like enzyme
MGIRIVVLSDLKLLPRPSVRRLLALQTQNEVEFVLKNPEWFRESRNALADFDGVLCRPNDGVVLTPLDLKYARRPFFAVSLSSGVDHFEEIRKMRDVEIINASGMNAESVAEHVHRMAGEIYSNTFRSAQSTAQGEWRQDVRIHPILKQFPQRLEGSTWLTVGAAAQVRHLLPRLAVSKIGTVIIRNRQMNVEKFERCLSGLSPSTVRQLDNPRSFLEITSASDHTTTVCGAVVSLLSDAETVVIATNSPLLDLLPLCDIVSLHIPNGPDTRNTIGKEELSRMKPTAVVINTARGEIIDEEAVVNAHDQGTLFGIAADVVKSEAERTKNPELSPLWRRVIGDNNHNIIVTPHVAGQILPDLARTCDDVVAKLEHLIEQHSERSLSDESHDDSIDR